MPPHETTITRESPLDQLRTIQLLEESLGPKSLRQLRSVLPDEASQRALEEVSRDSVDALRGLDDIIHEWTRHETGEKVRPAPTPALDYEEVLQSVIELKDSEAQMLKRAAETAPTDALAARLRELSGSAEDAAERLRGIL
jgi:hypothetical protein